MARTTRTGGHDKKSYDPAIDAAEGKSGWWKFVAGLNKLLNPGHAWTDYSSKPEQSAAYTGLYNLRHRIFQDDLTDADKAANAFSADEAQKQRDWEEMMANTAYQRQVKDMQAAGINPAMAMNANGAPTPSGASATSVSPSNGLSFSDLMQLLLMPMQKKLMASQAQQARNAGEAALITANANARNAASNAQNAGTNAQNALTQRMDAESRRMQVEIERDVARSRINLNESEVKRISEQTAFIKLQREQLPRQLDIAQQHADADSKRAISALRQADAAVQNAATNDRLADYETSLKYTQELLTWYQAEGQKVIAQYMPERARAEVDNLLKEGVKLDAQGRLINKQGNLVTAQMVKTYVNVGTDISGAVNQWLNPLSSGAGNSNQPGFDLTGAYQGVAYGYE